MSVVVKRGPTSQLSSICRRELFIHPPNKPLRRCCDCLHPGINLGNSLRVFTVKSQVLVRSHEGNLAFSCFLLEVKEFLVVHFTSIMSQASVLPTLKFPALRWQHVNICEAQSKSESNFTEICISTRRRQQAPHVKPPGRPQVEAVETVYNKESFL